MLLKSEVCGSVNSARMHCLQKIWLTTAAGKKKKKKKRRENAHLKNADAN